MQLPVAGDTSCVLRPQCEREIMRLITPPLGPSASTAAHCTGTSASGPGGKASSPVEVRPTPIA